MGGGLAVASGNEILASVPLEIAGLMSTQTITNLVSRLTALKEAAFRLGCIAEEPFMALSFLALPVIPELRLTDRGLVDVNQFKITPLFLDQG
jgi:adenine deaminase